MVAVCHRSSGPEPHNIFAFAVEKTVGGNLTIVWLFPKDKISAVPMRPDFLNKISRFFLVSGFEPALIRVQRQQLQNYTIKYG